MAEKNLTIAEMKKMQFDLYEKNKEKWNDMEPQYAKNHLLYMIEEMGECISIIKKKGIEAIMQEPTIRERYLEEFSDVLMYYTEVLNRLKISEEELSDAYVKKYTNNMHRDYIKDNQEKYNHS